MLITNEFILQMRREGKTIRKRRVTEQPTTLVTLQLSWRIFLGAWEEAEVSTVQEKVCGNLLVQIKLKEALLQHLHCPCV